MDVNLTAKVVLRIRTETFRGRRLGQENMRCSPVFDILNVSILTCYLIWWKIWSLNLETWRSNWYGSIGGCWKKSFWHIQVGCHKPFNIITTNCDFLKYLHVF